MSGGTSSKSGLFAAARNTATAALSANGGGAKSPGVAAMQPIPEPQLLAGLECPQSDRSLCVGALPSVAGCDS